MNKSLSVILAAAALAALASPLPAAAPAGAPRPGAAAPLVIKIGSLAPSRSPWDKALESMANDWERLSNGSVQVKVYPGGIAGSELDVIRKMRLGVLQGGVFSNMGLAKIDPSLTVLVVPFLFHSREEFNAVFDQMKPRFEQLIETQGFRVVLWTLAGWINFFTKTPVVEPDDLKKLKISVTEDFPQLEQVWKRMGYEVVPGESDMMIQLQSGAITALYLPPLMAASGQYFALAPHMLAPSMCPLVGGLVLSDRAWALIPADLRQPFLEATARAAKGLYDETMTLEADAVKMMKENGLVVHDPPASAMAKWRAAAEKAREDLVGSVFSKDVYDQVIQLIQAYRKAHGQ